MKEHGGSELSGLSGQWFVLSGMGEGRENVTGVHHRWLVKCYLGALPYFVDETVGSPQLVIMLPFTAFSPSSLAGLLATLLFLQAGLSECPGSILTWQKTWELFLPS